MVFAVENINQFAAHYQGLFTLLGSSVGIAGFLFGIWRYQRERKARDDLEKSKRELDVALSRLKHLDDLASDLNQYSAAM